MDEVEKMPAEVVDEFTTALDAEIAQWIAGARERIEKEPA